MAWVHGNWLVRGQPIEVQEVFGTTRGRGKRSMGWEARVRFAPDILVKTATLRPTAADAEIAIRDAFRAWCSDDDQTP